MPAGPENSITGYLTFLSVSANATGYKGLRAHLSSGSQAISIIPPALLPDTATDAAGANQLPRLPIGSAAMLGNARRWLADLPELRMKHAIYMAQPRLDRHGHAEQWQIYCRQPADAPQLFLRELTRYTDVIALPEWADPIWQEALEAGWAQPLPAHNIHAWQCRPNAAECQQYISDLLAQGRLPIPEPD